MLASTEGNCVRALMLGSHSCLSTALASSLPFRFECSCSQRSASTTSGGYVAAARICATSSSGYSAIGATNCSTCSGDCDTTGAGVCSVCAANGGHRVPTTIQPDNRSAIVCFDVMSILL